MDGRSFASLEELAGELGKLSDGPPRRVKLGDRVPMAEAREALAALAERGVSSIGLGSPRRLDFPVVHLSVTRRGCPKQASRVMDLVPAPRKNVGDFLASLFPRHRRDSRPCLVTGGVACPQGGSRDDACYQRLRQPIEVTAQVELLGVGRALSVRAGPSSYDLLIVEKLDALSVEFVPEASAELGSMELLYDHDRLAGQELLAAVNAGMYEPDYSPVGWLVTEAGEQRPVNDQEGQGNFYNKPNGSFALFEDRAVVAPSENAWPEVRAATQSGPLLVCNGQEHRGFDPDSRYRAIRNAVGTQADRTAVLVISNTPVTFHELVVLYSALGCRDALYLDGNVSQFFLPALQRYRKAGRFGPLLAVRQPTSLRRTDPPEPGP